MSRSTLLSAAAALAVALVAVSFTPPAAAEPQGDSAAPTGEMSLGDGLTGLVDPRTGDLTVALAAAELGLTFDSRLAGVDRFGFGAGWRYATDLIDTSGAVRVLPRSGGVFEADASAPSGLAGYPFDDLRFDSGDGTLPARADDPAEQVAYRFALHEPGVSTYFSADGLPVAEVAATGERSDWRWHDSRPGRLLSAVDPNGVITRLDWAADGSAMEVRRGAEFATQGEAVRPWRIEIGEQGIAGTTDPLGGRLTVDYEQGLISRVTTETGAVSEVDWRRFDDGVPRVATVRVFDASTGALLGRLEWRAVARRTAALWPFVDDGVAATAGAVEYETVLADGATEVASTYGARHQLLVRRESVADGAGRRLLREERRGYPGDSAGPARIESTSAGPLGTSSTRSSTFEYDGRGRPIVETAADGTIARTVYDDVIPPGAAVPVGSPVERRVTTPDGLVEVEAFELNAERTGVVRSERRSGRVGDAELTRTDLVEQTVLADGFVTEERRYPSGDTGAEPLVTTRARAMDPAAGRVTETETVAAGTTAATTTTETRSLVHGGIVAATDVVGNTTQTFYDELGRMTGQRRADRAESRLSYETATTGGRNARAVTGLDGVTKTEVFDAVGRVIAVTDDIDRGVVTPGHVRVVETHAYLDGGVEEVTGAWGEVARLRRDANGRIVEQTAPGGLSMRTEFDDVANTVTTGVTPTGDLTDAELVVTRRYDVAGRPVEEGSTRRDGVHDPAKTTAYDGFGREVGHADGRIETRVDHDAYGRPVRQAATSRSTEPQGGEMRVETEYDAAGVSVQKTRWSGAARAVGRRRVADPFGRTVEEHDQVGRVSRTTYTPDGLVDVQLGGDGRRAESRYDRQTRALTAETVTAPDGSSVAVAYDIDARTGTRTAAFDPRSPKTTRIEYESDAWGNTTEVRYPDGAAITHRYDEHGRKVSSTDVAGRTTVLHYDGVGRLVEAVQYADQEAATATDDAAVIARVRYAYDEFERLARLERGNGVVTEYAYTSSGEVRREATTDAGGALSSLREYEYDAAGLLTRRLDRERDDEGALTEATTAYTYDALGRLLESVDHAGDSVEAPITRRTTYEANAAGDVVEETSSTFDEGERSARDRRFEYSALGELVSITEGDRRSTQQFDDAGNLTRGADGATYSYDAANRLVGLHRGDEATSISYWPDGRRRTRSTAETSVTSYWDGALLVNEQHDGADPVIASYLLAAERHARTTGGREEVAYLGTDRHGNVTDLTDHRGDVTSRYRYSDYGEATVIGEQRELGDARSAHRNPFQYAGEYTDPDGRQLLGERIYDPGTHRFAMRDRAPQFTPYAYAELNPITFIDPTGRTAERDLRLALTIAGFLFAIGGVMVSAGSPWAILLMNAEILVSAAGMALDVTRSEPGAAVNIAIGATALGIGLVSAGAAVVGRLVRRVRQLDAQRRGAAAIRRVGANPMRGTDLGDVELDDLIPYGRARGMSQQQYLTLQRDDLRSALQRSARDRREIDAFVRGAAPGQAAARGHLLRVAHNVAAIRTLADRMRERRTWILRGEDFEQIDARPLLLDELGNLARSGDLLRPFLARADREYLLPIAEVLGETGARVSDRAWWASAF